MNAKFKFLSGLMLSTLLISMFGCKKEEIKSPALALGEIRCEINGVKHSFNISGGNTHHYDDSYAASPSGKVLQMGKVSSSSNPGVFAIDVFKDLDLLTIPYTNITKASEIQNGGYLDSWLTYTNMSDFSIWSSINDGSSTTLNITSKVGDVIEGTFSGVIYGTPTIDFSNLFAPPIQDSIIITLGEFMVPIIRESIVNYSTYP